MREKDTCREQLAMSEGIGSLSWGKGVCASGRPGMLLTILQHSPQDKNYSVPHADRIMVENTVLCKFVLFLL